MAGVPSTVQILSGDIVMPAGNTKTVKGLAEPTNNDDATTKNYVDTMVYDEIADTEGSYEARVQTTAIPGSGTSVLASTDGAKYSQVTTSTTGSSTLAKSKSVDGAWEVESEESVSSSSSAAHRTTTVTDGSNVAAQVAQIAAGTVTAGSQATQGAVDAILAAIASAVAGQITATVTDGVTTVGINGTTSSGLDLLARGATVPLNESGHEALPAGITSLVQGLGLLSALLDGNQLDAGTWTPTLAGASNVSTINNIGDGIYLKVGGCVVCAAPVEVTPTGSGTTIYYVSLPVASDFGATTDAIGVVRGQGVSSSDRVNASVPSDVLSSVYSSSAGGPHTQVVVALYKVIA